jgi:MFS family permease
LWVAGSLLADFIWSQVIDRSGSRAGLLGSAVLALAAPIVACVVVFLPEGWGSAPEVFSRLAGTGDLDGRHVLFMSTFILNSFAFDGRLISNMTYLLEMAPPKRRPTYVGLANTLTFPLALLPAAGGALAGLTSYAWLFAAAGGFAVIGLWAVKGLMVGTVPRDRKEVLTVERR